MKENKLENLIWIIFASIGAIFVIIGLVVFGNIFNYANKVDTVGTITEISSYRNTNHNRNHEVYVSYTVEGKEYESILNSYSSSFYEGTEIKIYYDKDNPSKIGVKSLDLLFLIFPGIGLIFLIIGGTGILVKINKRKLEKRLKQKQRQISRKYEINKIKKEGGERCQFIKTKNIEKLENTTKLMHRKLTNIRDNYIHQVTTSIVKTKPYRVVIEDLNASINLSRYKLA